MSAENQSVPGDQACSFDLLIESVGSCQMSSSSPTASTTAVRGLVGDHVVDGERKVRAVLLDRTDR